MNKFTAKFTVISFFFGFLLFLGAVSPVQASKLILSPASDEIIEGRDLVVDVVVNGNDELVDGVDAVINYDANFLAVKEIKEGSFFGQYPTKADEGSKITITALAPKDGVRIFGDVVVATLTFEILDSGETTLTYNFESNSTTDSNVPLHSSTSDSLTEVSGGTYDVTATPENLERARARRGSSPSPLIIFIPFVIVVLIALFLWWRNRRPKEDVYTPEPFPMDRPPTQ